MKRLHRYLDGEHLNIPLSSEELRDAADCEYLFSQTREAYRSIEAPDVSAAVMARLPNRVRATLGEKILGWLCTPRFIPFRPIYGFVLSAALGLVVVAAGSWDRSVRIENAEQARNVFVQFRLDLPNASQVRLAGTFTGWRPSYSLQQMSPGVWSVLVPLEPGVHEYAFVVDSGKWIPDPAAPTVDDGFGGVNSRVSVLIPNANSRL